MLKSRGTKSLSGRQKTQILGRADLSMRLQVKIMERTLKIETNFVFQGRGVQGMLDRIHLRRHGHMRVRGFIFKFSVQIHKFVCLTNAFKLFISMPLLNSSMKVGSYASNSILLILKTKLNLLGVRTDQIRVRFSRY